MFNVPGDGAKAFEADAIAIALHRRHQLVIHHHGVRLVRSLGTHMYVVMSILQGRGGKSETARLESKQLGAHAVVLFFFVVIILLSLLLFFKTGFWA